MSRAGHAVRTERLKPAAWRRFRTLRIASLTDAPDAFGSILDDALARDDATWARQTTELPTWVAVVDAEDAGLVRTCPDEHDSSLAWLLSMWVAPGARGRGAGDALLTAAIKHCRGAGFARLALDVGDANGPAIALYARHGFTRDGRSGTLDPPREHVREHGRTLELARPSA